MPESDSQIIIYQTASGQTRIEVRLENELDEYSTCKDLLQVQIESGRLVTRNKKSYALLPAGFPQQLAETIFDGLKRSAETIQRAV